MARPPALRRTTTLTAFAAAALLAVAACGSATSTSADTSAKLSPTAALHAGVTALQDAHALSYTLKLDATGQQLQQLEGPATSARDTQTLVSLVQGGSVVVAIDAGSATIGSAGAGKAGAGGARVAFTVNAGDQPDLVQVVDAGGTLYARAAVQKIAGYGGAADQAELSKLVAQIGAKYPFVAKAAAGDWLSFDLSDALQFARGADPSAVPSTGAGQLGGLQSALGAVLDKDVQVARTTADPTLGDHLLLTANARTVAAGVAGALQSSLSSVPGASSIFSRANPSSVPSREVTVDAYIKSGALDALKLNITPFLSPARQAAVHDAPIDVELDAVRSATVSTPANATTVTTAQVLGLLSGLSGGLGSATGTSESNT